VLLPKGTIYLGTQRNTIELSRVQKAYEEYIILTDTLSRAILRAWERNQNKPRCGLPRKIWKRLLVSGNCTGASLIRRRYGWLYRLSLGKSRPLCPSPKQGTIFHPLVETPDSSPHLFWLACRVERDGRGCDTPTIRLGLIGHFTKSICKIWVRIRVETQGLSNPVFCKTCGTSESLSFLQTSCTDLLETLRLLWRIAGEVLPELWSATSGS